MEWILQNKDWLFSGIGVVVVSGLVGIFLKRRNNPNQSIKSGDNSTNIQGGRDVKVNIGEKNDR